MGVRGWGSGFGVGVVHFYADVDVLVATGASRVARLWGARDWVSVPLTNPRWTKPSQTVTPPLARSPLDADSAADNKTLRAQPGLGVKGRRFRV